MGAAPARGAGARCVVPNLQGKTLSQANQALKRAHCGHAIAASRPNRKQAGWLVVQSQGVPAGEVFPPGSGVAVTLVYQDVKVKITEFPLASGSAPVEIRRAGDGNMWFALDESPQNDIVGRITPAGNITSFPLPSGFASYFEPGGTRALGMTIGPDGDPWLVAFNWDTRIAHVSRSGAMTFYGSSMAAEENGQDFEPEQIVWGPDGSIWYTDRSTQAIGRFSLSGSITNFHIPKNLAPADVTLGPDRNLWFTATQAVDGASVGYIGRLTPSGTMTLFKLHVNTAPGDIISGPGGDLWFTAGSGAIGRISTSGRFHLFPLPSRALPGGLTVGKDGNLWFTDRGNNSIGRLTPSGAALEFPLHTSLATPGSIATGPNGTLWFTELAAGKIGRAVVSPP